MRGYSSTHGGFFQAGDALDPDSPSYIVRDADDELLDVILSGEYCNVLTAQQMGKSSLIARTAQKLNARGVHTIYIDLAAVEGLENTPEELYNSLVGTFCSKLSLSLDEEWWNEMGRLGPVKRFDEFLQQVVLGQVQGRIVVFIDEIDSTLKLPFTDDFFALIRAIYNQRSTNEEYRRLTFVLAGVAQPTDLMKNPESTPYNIGTSISLSDFTREDVETLVPGLEGVHTESRPQKILERILYWTDGHPYLTQKLCAEIVRLGHGTWSKKQVDALVEQMFFQKGQLQRESNLAWIDEYIRSSDQRAEIMGIYGKVVSGKQVQDDDRAPGNNQLKLSGLVKVGDAGTLQVRNRIYAQVFGPEWAGIPAPRKRRFGITRFLLPGALLLVAALSFSIYRFVIQPRTMPTPTIAWTPTSAPTATRVITRTPEPTWTPTATPPSTLTPTLTATDRPATTTLTPTATKEPATVRPTSTSAATHTPTVTSTATPTATDIPTVTPKPTMVTIESKEGAARATEWASIFAYPNQEPHEVGIQPGQSVRILGQAAEPWSNWLYVEREQDGLKGFVWAPFFDIFPPLELQSSARMSLCDAGKKRFGFEVQVRGGDGKYTFYWEEQEATAVMQQQDGSYLVSWLWGTVPKVGELTVVSGDGQTVSSRSVHFSEPDCP